MTYIVVILVVLTLTHRYLVNAFRGPKTGCNTLVWKSTSGGKRKHKQYVRVYVFPVQFIFFALLFSLLVVIQIRGRITGSFPPSPLRFVREVFIVIRC